MLDLAVDPTGSFVRFGAAPATQDVRISGAPQLDLTLTTRGNDSAHLVGVLYDEARRTDRGRSSRAGSSTPATATAWTGPSRWSTAPLPRPHRPLGRRLAAACRAPPRGCGGVVERRVGAARRRPWRRGAHAGPLPQPPGGPRQRRPAAQLAPGRGPLNCTAVTSHRRQRRPGTKGSRVALSHMAEPPREQRSSRHLSVRVRPQLHEDLALAARRSPGLTRSGLVARLLDDGLRMDAHPGIVFRSGRAGRRPGLAAGPDVWEVARVLRDVGTGEPALRETAD